MRRAPLRFFQDILREVQVLQQIERELIDHVIVVCKLIYVNPATSATGERSAEVLLNSQTNQDVASIKNVASTFQPSRDFEHT